MKQKLRRGYNIHVLTHARTHARMHLHAQIHTHVRARAHTHEHTRARARTQAPTQARARARTHTHTRARARTHARTHAGTHARTHIYDIYTYVLTKKSKIQKGRCRKWFIKYIKEERSESATMKWAVDQGHMSLVGRFSEFLVFSLRTQA